MTDSTTKHETTRLENSTFNILIALGKEAQFLYSTIDTYKSDAERANRSDLVNIWNIIKQDRETYANVKRLWKKKQRKKI